MTQLRTSVVVHDRCCCPDPAYCHCPDHDAPAAPSPVMDRCGKSNHVLVAPTLSAFAAPAPTVAVAIATEPAPPPAVPEPHAPPEPGRPAAPS